MMYKIIFFIKEKLDEAASRLRVRTDSKTLKEVYAFESIFKTIMVY